MTTENKYLLFTNDKPISAYPSLEIAKSAAAPYIEEHTEITIELRNSPAQIQSWQYKYDISDWVQQL